MRFTFFLSAMIWVATTTLSAQSPSVPHGYNQLDASFEAEQYFDGRRRFLVDRQRWLNDQMFFWSRSFPGWAYYAEPWPFLPGDIYGYPLPGPTIRQPIDRVEEQIGPNTWFSRPLYAEELEPFAPAEVWRGAERAVPRGF